MQGASGHRRGVPVTGDDADRPGTLALRLRTSTLATIAAAARSRGVTQKQVICSALAGAGIPIAPADLEDRTPRRGRPRP
jgi:hypothetical protein